MKGKSERKKRYKIGRETEGGGGLKKMHASVGSGVEEVKEKDTDGGCKKQIMMIIF